MLVEQDDQVTVPRQPLDLSSRFSDIFFERPFEGGEWQNVKLWFWACELAGWSAMHATGPIEVGIDIFFERIWGCKYGRMKKLILDFQLAGRAAMHATRLIKAGSRFLLRTVLLLWNGRM